MDLLHATSYVGYATLAYFAYVFLSYARLHFLTSTSLSKYGCKKDGSGSWAVVTGAREGIGKGFAEALASRGFNIVLMARDEAGLRVVAKDIETKYKGVKTLVVATDASKSLAHETFVNNFRRLDIGVLVNNVGVNTTYPSELTETDEKDVSSMLDVNVGFTTRLTREMIPILKSRKKSLILMLSSYSGKVPIPMMAIYSATKAYNDAFARALAPELSPLGIDVVSIAPHYVVSQMSGFSRPSMSVPSATSFAQMTLNKVSAGASIVPHWHHDLFTRITAALPESFVGGMALKQMRHVRKKLIEKAAKKAAATQAPPAAAPAAAPSGSRKGK